MRAERSDAGRAAERGYPSPRAAGGAVSGRPAERAPRPPERRAPDPRGAGRPPVDAPGDGRRRGSSASSARAASTGIRGALAIAGVFLVTLVAAAADSYIGLGLGTITLVALTVGTIGAALVTRRGDLLSVLVAPPLVFVAVALLNIGLAPSASLNLPTLATLLVRGFPAMGLATGAALVITLGRLAARR
ncbi:MULTISPECIES: DUF6542 domain-containing protein [unclassified Modestobacter]|uniref:DUF6542 domain-containing protein n=1 Tax=unclassified Modestobacter TaxID=2643866 RepID=UPI0022A9FA18|nr:MULTISPECIES: DUF6542 domain-containing protein [unclassified Modestobacter]MCZ2827168.1 hypothetical protein [Modestobacter sp. VKM Ac-2981]MCZ2854419.1 hypothetical protein [Modestobacter sp. VKM Ac-2982]